MNDELNDTEQQIETYYAAERSRLHAPVDLWLRIEQRLPTQASEGSVLRRRWPAFGTTVALALLLAAGLWFAVGRLSGGATRNANEVLAAALDASEHPDTVGLQSFHGTAVFDLTEPADGPVPQDGGHDSDYEGVIKAEIPEEPLAIYDTSMQVWYGAPNRFRLEWTAAGPQGTAIGGNVIVTDGETTWQYDSVSNLYASSPTEAPDSAADFRVLLGPGAGVTSIGGLLAQLQADPGHQATLTGEKTFAGRRVYVLEIRPAWQHGSSGPDGQEVDESGGVVRLWIDKQYLFMLGWEADDGNGGAYGQHFTGIEFNGEVSDDLFRFTPPAGALEVDPTRMLEGSTSGGGSSMSGELGQNVDVAAGFLAPTDFPNGYQTRSVGESNEGATSQEEVTYEVDFLIKQDDGEGYISTQERRGRGDLPGALKHGDRLVTRSAEAWLTVDDAGLLHLAWQEGDLVVYIISRGLTQDQLLHLVDSMEVSTRGRASPRPSPSGTQEFVLPPNDTAP